MLKSVADLRVSSCCLLIAIGSGACTPQAGPIPAGSLNLPLGVERCADSGALLFEGQAIPNPGDYDPITADDAVLVAEVASACAQPCKDRAFISASEAMAVAYHSGLELGVGCWDVSLSYEPGRGDVPAGPRWTVSNLLEVEEISPSSLSSRGRVLKIHAISADLVGGSSWTATP